MILKTIFNQLNIIGQCKKYGISLGQCPQFLFLVMGGAIIVSSLTTYTLGTRYIADPDLVVLIVLILTIVLLVITFFIVRSMEGLAEANRLKSEFINIVSHQLRSPLSNLKWALELLVSGRLGEPSDKQLEYFKILEENTGRMGELVSDLLTVSRIEQGKLPLEKKEFSLEGLTKETLAEFEPYARASNAKVRLDIPQSLPAAFGDRARLKIVLENLLDNAIRYSDSKGPGEIHIKIKLEKNLIFEIKDNGVGIPSIDQRHIFQKFFRSSNILKYQTQGSGLGLYIVKFIIEKSGGKIWFRSREGVGSTFWFTLPIFKK